MTDEARRWVRVKTIFQAALGRKPEDRPLYLDQVCGVDISLRLEVESLLDAHVAAAAVNFAAHPAIEALAIAQVVAPPSLVIGQRLAHYQIEAELGAGGMGVVYKARDTRPKLCRTVAIKVLPPDLRDDPELLMRFEQEGRTLAALNHTHICVVFDVGEDEGLDFLVMEYVAGETLSDRLAKTGALPVREGLAVASDMADALEAAHAQGIIHRDLKPANIKITPDGVVKVLDFGVAKIARDDRDGVDLPQSSDGKTREGTTIGTAAYMSPEQARGKPVDKRADVWAFGCVLYEMLTGRMAFPGETLSDTIAAVLTREPDWSALPEATPAGIRRLVRRCLERDLKRRLRDIGDARIEVDDALTDPLWTAAEPPDHHPNARWRRIATGATVLGIVATLSVSLALYLRPATSAALVTRLSVSTPGQISPQFSAVISPDGRQLAFVSTDSAGKAMLWVRALDTMEARMVPGTERATFPFWSPDSGWLAFTADGRLKKVASTGGPVLTIADKASSGTWSNDGVILFPRGGGLAQVPAEGGAVSTVVAPDPSRSYGFSWPQFLPDGRHFLFFAQGKQQESRGVYVGSLDSTKTMLLLKSEFKATYAPPGYLLFMRDAALMAQRFDAARLELSGAPALVADGVFGAFGPGQVSVSVSAGGVLAYVNATSVNSQWGWVDREGRLLGRVGSPDLFGKPRISPDGKRIAFARGRLGFEDIWLLDPVSGVTTRFTFDPASDTSPTWSGDGERILFNSSRGDGRRYSLYERDSSGNGSDRLLLDVASDAPSIQDSSLDGRFLVAFSYP